MRQPVELDDGRVRLRAVAEKDRASVLLALNDELAHRFLYRPPFPYRDEHFDEWLALGKGTLGLSQNRAAHWTIASSQDDTYLGGASLELDVERASGEIGYQVAPWARGRGVATGALRLIREFAFDVLELARLEIVTDVDNVVSMRVAQAAGFTGEGVRRGYLELRAVRRDHAAFAMLAGDARRPAAPVPWPRLDDGLVLVRPFEHDDAEAVAAACVDPPIARWIFRLPAPYSLADAVEFIGDARRHLVSGVQVRLAVADSASGELLGSISLEPSWRTNVAELGYWVKREARRRGVATAAARLVIRWAFEELGFGRLELQTYPGNDASQRLATSLGFRREGLRRGALPPDPGKDRTGRVETEADGAVRDRDDQVLFSLLKGEWARGRA
jgi:RimJ/RimL family protein N-acetyltransferase